MVLYEVRNGIITIKSVKKETDCGWRQHNNGFINRRVLREFVSLETSFYTTDIKEARLWSDKITSHIHNILQVSKASISDVELWKDDGMNESYIPKSRYIDVIQFNKDNS